MGVYSNGTDMLCSYCHVALLNDEAKLNNCPYCGGDLKDSHQPEVPDEDESDNNWSDTPGENPEDPGYTIYLNFNGGTYNGQAAMPVYRADSFDALQINDLPVPTHATANMIFRGWSLSKTGAILNNGAAFSYRDKTLYAIYGNRETFTINYFIGDELYKSVSVLEGYSCTVINVPSGYKSWKYYKYDDMGVAEESYAYGGTSIYNIQQDYNLYADTAVGEVCTLRFTIADYPGCEWLEYGGNNDRVVSAIVGETYKFDDVPYYPENQQNDFVGWTLDRTTNITIDKLVYYYDDELGYYIHYELIPDGDLVLYPVFSTAITPTSTAKLYTKVDGTYRSGIPYIKVNGQYKKGLKVYAKVDGVWKCNS